MYVTGNPFGGDPFTLGTYVAGLPGAGAVTLSLRSACDRHWSNFIESLTTTGNTNSTTTLASMLANLTNVAIGYSVTGLSVCRRHHRGGIAGKGPP